MGSVFDRPEFNESLFFPRPDPGEAPADAEDFLVPVGGGARVHARRHRSFDANVSLLLFHGNGEIVSDYDALADEFRGLGVELVACDYRGYGKSTGTPGFRDVLADAHVVLVHLQAGEHLKDCVCVFGRSLGSAPAIELAVNHDEFEGLVIESGFADPRGMLARRGVPAKEFDEETDRIFDNAEKIGRVRCPLLVIHGQEDDLIPVSEGVALHDRAGSEPKRLVVLTGVGHNDILWGARDEWLLSLRDFFDDVRDRHGRPAGG